LGREIRVLLRVSVKVGVGVAVTERRVGMVGFG